MSPPDQREGAPKHESAFPNNIGSATDTLQDTTLYTRSSDLGDALDASATAEVSKMVDAGWEPGSAAASWREWVGGLAEAAADGAQAEGSWEAS